MTAGDRPRWWRRRWRLLAAAPVGAIGCLVAWRSGLPYGLAMLIGWNLAAAFFLITTLWLIWGADEPTVRRRAAAEDEGPSVTSVIVLSVVAAGLAATVLAMHDSKGATAHGLAGWAWVFSITTLVQGWLVVQTLFTLHYAHRYFGDGLDDQKAKPGVEFPGDAPNSYQDFFYMAVCIGASAQVSDFSITHTRFRRLVTAHSLLSFFFNTAVLALGINILASLIGQ